MEKELKCVPITENTDQDLTDHNAGNLEVGDGVGPLFVAGFIFRPTIRPDGLEKRCQVTNGKENVTGERQHS
jgi:hypothetical protein